MGELIVAVVEEVGPIYTLPLYSEDLADIKLLQCVDPQHEIR